MALATRSASLLLLALASLSSLSSARSGSGGGGGSGGGVLHEYCQRTHSPKPCVDFLSRLPESRTTKDPHHLAELGIRVVADIATNVSTYIDHILDATATNDSAWQPVLQDCSQSYIDAVEQADDCTFAMDHPEVKDGYKDVGRLLDAASASVETCQAACRTAKTLPEKEKEEMMRMNKEFLDATKIVMSLVDATQNKPK